MKCNVGMLDRVVRVVIGLLIIVYGFIAQNWLGAIGAIPLLTGLFSFCPFYPILGLNTGYKRS